MRDVHTLGTHQSTVDSALVHIESQDVVGRIWREDHTVWKPDPTEINNRLGWLTISKSLQQQVFDLEALSAEVRAEGYLHVVVLGMGGSSLGPEVLCQTFGHQIGYPELIILDSTLPEWVNKVADTVDPSRTLFIVSSKSGTTIEPLVFYKYFRGLLDVVVGRESAGPHFVSVTDPGTPLAKMGVEEGFRRVFENQADIGGRYSVLSHFGLVPAALAGTDVRGLLDSAEKTRQACSPSTGYNPGASLGAAIGSLAKEGQDKLTLITTPAIESFGLWVEQLLAESTGKEGTGIVPIAGEPVLGPDAYGDDRFFVYLRLEGDDKGAPDSAVDSFRAAGHPVLELRLNDKNELGSEFFRWEFATAIAGTILGIQPFDQPNVQSAKAMTNHILEEYKVSGRAPSVAPIGSLEGLLAEAEPGDYLAIMAYVCQTPEIDAALSDLRARVMRSHRIATTLGYGPRLLHSTGQLHKGGPDSGLFLQVTQEHEQDLKIPGEPYTFGVLADAQAVGDMQALQDLGRRGSRIHIEGDIVNAIENI